MNEPLTSYEELLEEVHDLRSRLASLKRVEEERRQVQREREEARNNATEAIRVCGETLLALRDSEQQYRDLTEALPQLIWLTRPDGWHVYFNQKWCEYTGMTLDESYGHGWNLAFHPDDRQRAWNRWKQAIETGEAYEIEYRLRRADGSYHWVLGRALPLRDTCGQIVKWFGTCTDIDGQKRAEEALRDANRLLVEAERAKSVFLSNISHEFRTPLTLLLGPIEDVLGEAAADLPEDRREKLLVAHRNGLRLMKLVNGLLDFSRFEAGRFDAFYEPTNLAALTAELASNFSSACEKAGLHLMIECPPLAEPVYVDRDMWEKIVLNLVSNAFKFTLAGEIAVVLRRRGDQAELTVRDTGVGIPESELPRIFDRFYRVEGAKGRTYEGAGIGLALVQELIKLHGGKIRAESAAGLGTTFRVSIPLGVAHLPPDRVRTTPRPASTTAGADAFVKEALGWLPGETPKAAICDERGDAASDEASKALLRETLGESQPRIALADDNADMRAYLRRLLETAGYCVDTFANGAAALVACTAAPPDLIVTDIMMPELDGVTLLQRLRADSRTRAIPVILVSARAGEEARVEGLRAGADDYIAKPFGGRELVARVEGAIRLNRMRHTAAMRERELQAELEAGRAKAALRESEVRIRRLVDANIIGIIIFSLDGRIIEANEAFLAMAGYDRKDLLSEQIRWTEMTPPEWRAADQFAVDQIRASGSCKPFEKEYFRKDGSRLPVLLGAASFQGTPEEGVAFVLDLSVRKEAEERQKVLLDELNHRVKNTLATVLALSAQTFRTTDSPEAFREAFEGRLLALSQTHNLLNRSCWTGVSLRDILLQELAPYASADDHRIFLDGDDLKLGSVMAVTLGMAFHELATNAAKYGALSAPGGSVRVAWRTAAPGRLRLEWQEMDGPRVSPPRRRGYGSRLIEQALAGALDGDVGLHFLSEGVRCTMDIPSDQLSLY
jgi:PAS domain S-box-containing protein